ISEMCPDAVFEEIVDMYPVVDFGEAQSASDEITSPKFTSRVYPNKQEERKIKFTTDLVNKKLGSSITDEEVEKILKNYNFEFFHQSDWWEINVPALRLDLENPIDMVEEIGRIYGYDKLTPVLPTIDFKPKTNDIYKKICFIRNVFVRAGYKEVMTYSFTNKGEVEVMESASDKNFLRTNLTDGLKKSYELNRLNGALLGIDEVKIFEIGTVFTKKGEQMNIAYANKKEVKEINIMEFDSSFLDHKSFFDRSDEFTGNIIPEILLEKSGDFKMWSVYPFITRDLSLWVNNDSDKDLVLEIIKEAGKELLIKNPQILDRFEKEGKISFAFRMVFQSYDRTLSDEEVSKIMEQINQKVVEKGYIPR
ncbi:hypothetical protein IT400_01125, partial [Candidatus Nomurabacteria bacterium]|nr:hypothetical protein [Candidatus Nomurabacteria bacterium]